MTPRGSGVFGEEALRDACARALHATEGDQAEALVVGRTQALTRFANNAIHQNVASTGADLRIRVVRGKRVAAVWTNRLDPEGLAEAARRAGELAGLAPENPEWPGLPAGGHGADVAGYVEATATTPPEVRARLAARICDPVRAAGLRAAGYVATAVSEVAVASTLGTWAYHAGSVAEVQVVAIGDGGSAYADRVAAASGSRAPRSAATEAITAARRAQAPRDVGPGTYEVVLLPYAVADVVEFLGSELTGLAVEEGHSFVAGRLGERVTGEAVTLTEDPCDRDGLPRGFDFEGVPTARLTLIESGLARAVVHDSQTAARARAANTGHALASETPHPLPMHLRLEPGSAASPEALVRGVRRGILVTRFWYTRWVHPLRTVVTGMTRDGTFWIEDGEIAYPIKSLRFTQSYHEALTGVIAMTRTLKLQRLDLWDFDAGSIRVPAVHLGAFEFTG